MKKLFLILMLGLVTLSAYAGDDLKTNYRTALVLAYSPANSVFEDENIRLEIYNEQLWAMNKTDRTIFIDLSQCFLMHNGSSYPMFDNHQDEKNASKKDVSTSIDEFISIAPTVGSKQNDTKICNLAGALYGKYTTTESPSGSFTEYEERLLSLVNELTSESLQADPNGKNYIGTSTRHLTEDESVNNIGASIAYAFSKRSENWIPVTISTWVSDVCFAPYYVEMPILKTKKEMRGFGVKKTEAAKIHIKADSPFEFDNDRSPVIVLDWTGDFKKGTFELTHTWVKKRGDMSLGKVIGASFLTIATGGLGASIFADIESVSFKKEIYFNGIDSDWGKMTYMKNKDLSKFNNKR